MQNVLININNAWQILVKMIRYNLKIIFMNRFIWFFIAAILFYMLIIFLNIYNKETLNEAFIYGALIFPGFLLLFYPTVFGIQTDQDARILEILFGIPDYRYKIWLVRIILIFIIVFLIILVLTILSSIGLFPLNVFEMSYQLMFPLFFIGSFAFMISTWVKSGYGTAVIIIVVGLFLLILADVLERSMWNVFLNPFNVPSNLNEMVWYNIAIKNRIFLGTGIMLFLLTGLLNLQNREKFIN